MLSNSIDVVFKDQNVKDHNNMVPYFGSNIKQNTDINRVSTNNIEMQYGQNYYKPKREKLAELPQKNISYINGTPLSRDLTRYTQSMYRPDQKPIEAIHVGPGLDKGYCSSGNDGFHNSHRIQYKN